MLPLLVPLYDRTDPTLFGFPFYFWFQFALIPVAAVLTVPAYVLAKGADSGPGASKGCRRGRRHGRHRDARER